MKKLSSLLVLVVSLSMLGPLVTPVFGLSAEQKRVIDGGSDYVDIEQCVASSGAQLNGDTEEAQIYNYLLGKTVAGQDLKDFQVAGILGNMHAESGYQHQRLQNTPSGVVTPAEDARGSKLGYGLVQWTPAGKMIDAVTAAGKDPNSLSDQLDFLLEQLNGQGPAAEGPAGELLVATTDVASATITFETKYERHAGAPQATRVVEAQRILQLAQSGGISGGSATADATDTTTGTGASDAARTSGSERPVIALDPGHGGTTIDRTDPETGLHDGDFPNHPELEQVFDVSQIVKTRLEADGYQVVMTKDNANDAVFLRDRANKANDANASLAVSIHTQGDETFGTWQQIYTQKVGLFRGSGANKATFDNQELADKSMQYAQAMKTARDANEVTSGTTEIKDNSFDGRAPIEPGNIPLVQLFATVPWIYLEAGGLGTSGGAGLTQQDKQKYADGIIAGIESSVPATGTTDNCGGSTAAQGNGDAVATALSYAWPEYHPAPFTDMKPEYQTAITNAQAAGQYVGGVEPGNRFGIPGIDCGGFVTRVMVDSAFEPRYNFDGAGGPTGTQQQWLDENWEKLAGLTDPSQLQPGDVAIKSGHTYMYVGENPGFETKIASASLRTRASGGRAPMAGHEDLIDPEYTWYRKRG